MHIMTFAELFKGFWT